MFNLDLVAIFSILTVIGSVLMLVLLGLKARTKIFGDRYDETPEGNDNGKQ
jgi:hypothetical protein